MSDQAATEFILLSLDRLSKFNDPPLPESDLRVVKLLTDDDRKVVKQLTDDVSYLDAFLRYASKKQVNAELLGQIRSAVVEAEEVVGTFVTQSVSTKARNWFSKVYPGKSISLDETAVKIQKVREDAEKVHGDATKLEIGEEDDGSEKLEVPSLRKHVVGLDESASELIGYLKEKTEHFDVISIVGVHGIGKTTLARKVFQDQRIQDEFPMRLWASVSRVPTRKVLLDALREFKVERRDMHRMRESDLASLTRNHLQGKKFLIVFDDVRTTEDWTKLSYAFPTPNLGKVLITTSVADVAQSASQHRSPFETKPLNSEESVELLKYEAFGGSSTWEPEIERLGRSVAEKCKGSPLTLTVIGGVVGKEPSLWTKLSDRLLVGNDQADVIIEKVFSLSYEELPTHLRECLLFFAMFPDGVGISAWKLYRMWIAEGFLGKWTNSSRPEATAEGYLYEFIGKNLVSVEKQGFDGKVKTIRVHGPILDSIKKRAAHENFVQEVKASEDETLQPPINVERDNDYLRFCFHTNLDKLAASKPYGRRARSVVCTNPVDIVIPLEHISGIPGGFKLLKIFDFKPIKLPKLPAPLFDLLHVKLVHLSYDISTIPPAFTRFRSLETLIVEASQRALEIRAEIWKMTRLKHLKTNATATILLPGEANSSSMVVLRRAFDEIAKIKEEAEKAELADSNLQTLGVISSESCTEKILSTLGRLRRASIRGKLAKLLNGTSREGSFSNFSKLVNVEKLKLLNELPAENPESAWLTSLPQADVFPPQLRVLTLSDTFLPWSAMEVLASLEKLEVLKLKKRAFMGKEWKTEGGFRGLKHLLVGETDLTEWKSEGGHFPALEHLELQFCSELLEVPIKLADVGSLKVLSLNSCHQEAVESARKIEELKKDGVFELTIVSLT